MVPRSLSPPPSLTSLWAAALLGSALAEKYPSAGLCAGCQAHRMPHTGSQPWGEGCLILDRILLSAISALRARDGGAES